MKKRILIWLLLSLMVLTAVLIYKHVGKVKLVAVPPQSLAQWYKPENKRHVWLHNMFKLRREMQAVGHYAEVKNAEELDLWMGRLSEHYGKIAEMVPEWERRLDRGLMQKLVVTQKASQFEKIPALLDELQVGCDSCHDRYRVVTALLFRAPDFHALGSESSDELSKSMVALNQSVNQIKVAFEAGDSARSLVAFGDLEQGIEKLGSLCVQCHEHLPKVYPDKTVTSAMAELKQHLQSGNIKEQGKSLGTVAVIACAQCHGTHRIAADVRRLLSEEKSFTELFTH